MNAIPLPIDSKADTSAESTGASESFSRQEDGSSLIEFALCLPPLMLLMTGIFAFGIAMGNYVMLTNACSAGAMQLAISRGQLAQPNYDPCALAVSAAHSAMLPNDFSANGLWRAAAF